MKMKSNGFPKKMEEKKRSRSQPSFSLVFRSAHSCIQSVETDSRRSNLDMNFSNSAQAYWDCATQTEYFHLRRPVAVVLNTFKHLLFPHHKILLIPVHGRTPIPVTAPNRLPHPAISEHPEVGIHPIPRRPKPSVHMS